MAMSGAPHLLSVPEALGRIAASITKLDYETIDLESALGRVLAKPVISARAVPPFRASAMDGYAIRQVDAPGCPRVVGASTAGDPFRGQLDADQAVRIFTGAALPAGADWVVPQEQIQVRGNRIEVGPPGEKSNVRPLAGDYEAGAVILQSGLRLDSVALTAAATAGGRSVRVARGPRVSILTLGNELVAPGGSPRPDQIFDSVSFGITGLVQEWGGFVRRTAPAPDDLILVANRAEDALDGADLLIVIGGASVGDHDFARGALVRIGMELIVDGVRIRPGKPFWFGRANGCLVLGLPGNPAAALVCAFLLLEPLMGGLQGISAMGATWPAVLEGELPAPGDWTHCLRGSWGISQGGKVFARPAPSQDTSLVSVFQQGNALIIRRPGDSPAPPGGIVEIKPFRPPTHWLQS